MYCRKSTEEETRQVNSIGKQKLLLQEVVDRFGITVVKTFEESKSAKEANHRPEFNAMLNGIKNGEADSILVLSTDRLSRNLSEADVVIKLFDAGILKEVRTPTNVYNTSKDFFYMGFDFLFATQYSRDLSVKVKEGFSNKIKRGVFPHQAPLGYLNQNGQIVIDPKRAKYIQMMFFLIEQENYSTRQVVEHLFDLGLRSRIGKKIVKSAIHRYLSNPFYCGDMVIKGLLYTATHEPLVSRQTFDTVQYILHGKQRPRPKKRYFLYRDYLSCGDCFCKLTATIKKGRYNYYYCTNGKGVCEQHNKYLTEKMVDEALDEVFEPFQFDSEVLDLSFELYKQSLQDKEQKNSSKIEIQQNQIDEYTKQEIQLTTKLAQGIVSDTAYQLAMKGISEQKERLQNRIAEYKNPDNPKVTLELLEKVKSVAVSGYTIHKSNDLEAKRLLLKSALWNCMIKDGKVTNKRYKSPFNFLVKYSKNDDFVKMRG